MTAPLDPFDVVDLILRKRDGGALTTAEIDWLVPAFTAGRVLDAQMSAFAMAVCLRGMTDREISDLTTAMVNSGVRHDYSDLGRPVVDKHSTGGVGDKVTLVLMPVVASFGAIVPQLSGRGLGHTGGTLDKLESIPGWRADLTGAEIREQLQRVGGVVCAPGADLAPADRRLYALRDATGTVESIPLMASSIMSKKIAEGAEGLVLNVTTGGGAFMRQIEDARRLARTMVAIGTAAGVRTRAVITSMEAPLGLAIGNANEVAEAVDALAGDGPSDLRRVVCTLARHMLDLAGLPDADPAQALDSGAAMDVWRQFVAAQDGDPDAPLPAPAETEPVTADRDGWVGHLDALAFGIGSWRLGAGRSVPGAPVSHAAGIDLRVKPGDQVHRGDVLYTLRADDPARFERAEDALRDAVTIQPAPGAPDELIREVIG
jgi:thymidine phosphorylase